MSETTSRSDSTPKLREKMLGGITGKGFVPGFDPKRNLKGRPKSFDQFRELAQKIGNEELQLQDGRRISVAEAMLRKCAKSDEAALIKTFFEYAFGKVPDKLETDLLGEKPVLVLHIGQPQSTNGQN